MSSFALSDGLRNLLANGRCVAFVGAGFSRPVGMPTWADLLRVLVAVGEAWGRDPATLERCRQSIDNREFTLAASVLRKVLTGPEIDQVLRAEYSEAKLNNAPSADKRQMLARMSALVSGPWVGIITTNYDTLIERAISEAEHKAARIATDYSRQLGTILHELNAREMFFVKLHGSVTSANAVLSTAEYNEAYYASNKIRNFLFSVMMSYTTLFLGSSLEDDIVGLRRELCVEYDGHVPNSFALMESNDGNMRRSEWLREFAKIESLFYPVGRHEAMDDFLEEASGVRDLRKSIEAGVTAKVVELRGIADRKKVLGEIGLVNREIYRCIAREYGGVITKPDIFGGGGFEPLYEKFGRLTPTELFYRLIYLVNAGLVEEIDSGDEMVYSLR